MQTTKTKTRTKQEEKATTEAPQTERDSDAQALLDSIDDVIDALDEIIEDSDTETEFIVAHAIAAEVRARSEDTLERAKAELQRQYEEDGYILLPCGC